MNSVRTVGLLVTFVVGTVVVPTAASAQGWYLMVPPDGAQNSATGLPSLQLRAPLARWEQWRAFDSARECSEWQDNQTRQERAEFAMRARNDTAEDRLLANVARGRLEIFVNSQCVSAADPRLAPSGR